jgi:hypothetical protein
MESVPDGNDGAKPKAKIDEPRTPPMRSIWSISEIKRKLHERKAKYEHETPPDKASRRTANATVAIAWFTVVLALVGALTLYEVIGGGSDTAKLAQAAVDQALAMKLQEQHMEMMAEATKAQAIAAISQVQELETLAKATQGSARLLRESNRNAVTALHLTEAADIELDHINCNTIANPPTPQPPIGLTTDISVAFLNRGRTSATVATSQVFIGFYGRPIRLGPGQPSVSVVGPGQPLLSAELRVGAVITEDELRLVNDGIFDFHLWGWAIYMDRFSIHHMTIFDATYVPRSVCAFRIVKMVSR